MPTGLQLTLDRLRPSQRPSTRQPHPEPHFGIDIYWHNQTAAKYNEPIRRFSEDLTERRIRHGHDPVLTWAADNLVVKSDAEGRCKPDKQKADEKIDPMVAMYMAYGEMLYAEEDTGPGAYASPDCGVAMF